MPVVDNLAERPRLPRMFGHLPWVLVRSTIPRRVQVTAVPLAKFSPSPASDSRTPGTCEPPPRSTRTARPTERPPLAHPLESPGPLGGSCRVQLILAWKWPGAADSLKSHVFLTLEPKAKSGPHRQGDIPRAVETTNYTDWSCNAEHLCPTLLVS